MRIVFVGAVEFSRRCLRAVLDNGGHVVGVITLDVQHARRHADFADLSPIAEAYDVPVYKIDKLNDELELLRSLQTDIVFIFGWSQLLSKELLDLPPMGCVGTHPALLPRNRGRHPLIWALVEGLEESGLTFFYLDEGVDSGDILWQQPFQITLGDDAGSLYEKICQLGEAALAEFLPRLMDGTAPRIPQDHSQATFWRKRSRADGMVDWSQESMTIYNVIRALTHPYPGAETTCNGESVLLWKAKLPEPADLSTTEQSPGTVLAIENNALHVRSGDGKVMILDFTGPTPRIGDQLGG